MHSSFFHAHRLGYRRNPFGALNRTEWTAVAFLPPALETICKQGFMHLQLLGPQGVGKSSTLHKLQEQVSTENTAVQYEYIPHGQNRFHIDLQNLNWYVLDEAQRLNKSWRRRWLQWGKKETDGPRSPQLQFIFSSHQDLTPYFKQHRLPLITFDIASAVTPAHYQQWLAGRLGYFALPDTPRLSLAADAASWLYATFSLDMRAAEYFLYEVWQAAKTPIALNATILVGLYGQLRDKIL